MTAWITILVYQASACAWHPTLRRIAAAAEHMQTMLTSSWSTSCSALEPSEPCTRSADHCTLPRQLIVLQHADVDLVLRVTCTDSLSPQEQEEALGYHCYRGLLAPGTAVYLTADAAEPGSGEQGARRTCRHAACRWWW